jgi:predicted TIM-barrel fold metal-dependent hydrolase
MIIDAHVHHTWADPNNPPWVLIEQTFALAEQVGIDKIGFLGTYSFHGYDPTEEGITQCNTHAAKIVAHYPDHSYSLCYLNPAHPPAFVAAELKRCVEEFGMKGIKQWIAVNARDSRMERVMTGAIEYSLPVFFHAWYKATGYVYNESNPSDIRHLALRYPEATLVMLHLNGCGVRGVQDIADLPNVWVDTSGSQPDAGFVEYAVEQLGAERILFGSDMPIRDYGTQLAKVTGANISSAAKTQILGENARRLLQL